LVEAIDLTLRAITDLPHLALARLLDLPAYVGLGTLRLELGEVGLELRGALLDLVVASALRVTLLGADLRLHGGHVAVARLRVDARDDVGREVDDLLEVLRCKVEQVTEPARYALEIPDVRHRRRELDVAHALAAHLGTRHLDAAPLADDALEADALVF